LKVERINDNINFGILKGYKKTSYGEYMWGTYKGHKIEVFDAKKHQQKLIYISNNSTLKWLMSKLTYIQNGIMKVMRSKAR
jgi:hypothetical protein